MSENQADLLENLTALRHELHTNQESYFTGNSDILQRLVDINAKLDEEGIAMPFIPIDRSDYIDIDNIDILYELGEVPEDNFDEWYEKEFNRINEELEELNSQIEQYLGEIDKKYGTSYKPGGHTRFRLADKEVENVIIDTNGKSINKAEAINVIPKGGIVKRNRDTGKDINISRKSLRHSALHNENSIYIAYNNIGEIIENAIKIGEIPVAEDEIGKTNSVSIFYIPINIDGTQYSARLVAKELINKDIVLDTLSLYNMAMHKEKTPSNTNVGTSNDERVYSDGVKSMCKVKDLIHNTQENDKKLLEIDEETRFRHNDIFISNAENAVLNIKQSKATPSQWIAMLKNNGGLKAGEDKIRDVEKRNRQAIAERLKDVFANREGVRFRLIGETSAEFNDLREGITARMDNLAKAKEMLKNGEHIADILSATDWTLRDGKWMYREKKGKRYITNYDLSKDEIKAIQDYIESLPKDTEINGALYFENNGYIYKFDTSIAQYEDNRKSGRDGFKILKKVNLNKLTDEQRNYIQRGSGKNIQAVSRLAKGFKTSGGGNIRDILDTNKTDTTVRPNGLVSERIGEENTIGSRDSGESREDSRDGGLTPFDSEAGVNFRLSDQSDATLFRIEQESSEAYNQVVSLPQVDSDNPLDIAREQKVRAMFRYDKDFATKLAIKNAIKETDIAGYNTEEIRQIIMFLTSFRHISLR